jgi:hypothetical protein
MTTEDRRQSERRRADERCVDALLAESGCADDAELRAVLLELRTLRVTEVPEPSAEVAALMGEPADAEVVSLADRPRRHRRKKRAVFTSLAVAASLGIAGGAAAGNDGLRSQAEETIRAIFSSFTNPTPTTPAPAPPAKAPEPAPAVVPSPVVRTAGTAPVVPVVPAPVTVPTAEPSSGERHASSPGRERGWRSQQDGGPHSAVPRRGGKPAEPGASRSGDLPSRADRPAVDGTGGDWPPGSDNARSRERHHDWAGQGGDRHGGGHHAGQHNNGRGQGNRR